MKNFLKSILASTIGTFIAIFVAFGILFLIGLGFVSFYSDLSNSKNSGPITEKGLLKVDVNGIIPDQTNNTESNIFNFNIKDIVGLHAMKELIVHAATDEKIEGILLNLGQVNRGYSGLSEIRQALEQFSENSEKPIFTYSEGYSQSQYYVASVADSIYLNPNGTVNFLGLGIQIPYFKDALENIGVDVEVYYVGNFKSATEPFRRNNMSEEDRIQKRAFLEDLNDILLTDISESRSISKDSLKSISDNYLIRNAQDAMERNFVDKIGYYSEFIDDIKVRLGYKTDEKINIISLERYHSAHKSIVSTDFDAPIALVYAEGSIVSNGGDQLGIISDEKYNKILRNIQADEKIKAVVLRVNSPGGSAIASDNIWHEIENLKAAGKKVIVSMGDYAASGGYYISCNADRIFSEPSTITGSIGVFGMFFNPQELLNKKIGVHFDTVQTGTYTNSFAFGMGKKEKTKQIIQESVEDIYNLFTSRVAEGRSISIDEVKALAGGRIYSGRDALDLKLVDELGSLQDAIAYAAELVEVDKKEGKYAVKIYPEVKDPFIKLMEELQGEIKPEQIFVQQLPVEYKQALDYFNAFKNMNGIQMRMPHEIIIK